ncbi:uncharacterized protein LOC126456049 [Schistocerca serialis cubense]|uniref:uncharacterized protein LOC126456049 n=1 Tax=Schistocerca serialis cubense TaxID=2023355 RepID=UPI00214ED6F3|nr:uncharacterized protein LOC126456049 [Schistocerca serialis cubense]
MQQALRTALSVLALMTLTLPARCCGAPAVRPPQMDPHAAAVVADFARQRSLHFVVAFTCWPDGGVSAMHAWGRRGLRASVHEPWDLRVDLGRLLDTRRGAVAVFAALSCPGALHVFRKAADRQLLGVMRHWLLLGDLEPQEIPQLALDSSVTLLSGKRAASVSWLVRYAYGLGERLVVSEPAAWQQGEPMPAPPSRNNLQGLAIKAGIVKLNDNFSHYDDPSYRHLDTWSKLYYAISKVAAARLNYTHNIVFANQWGMRVSPGVFNGQVGQLQRGEIELALGFALRRDRIDVIDYTTPPGRFQPAFMFREPSLAAVSNVYTRPFSRGVWLSYSLAALLLALLVVASQRLLARAQGILDDNTDPAVAPPWTDVPLVAFSIVCEEGMQDPPQNVSSRILLMFLLVLAVFHVTAYSACIVSLLQLPSGSINALDSLFGSKLRVVMHDLPYNFNYGNETKDPLTRSFYQERVYPQPYRKVFKPLEECVAMMREGRFACHADEAAYKVIGDTFLEAEKCSLKSVPMFPLRAIIIGVRKQSPYKEILSVTLTWLRETGMTQREWTRWVAQKPRCLNRDSGYAEVGLTEVSPALLMLCYGVAASLTALLLELLLHRLVAARQGHQKRQQKPSTDNTLVPRAFLR